MSADTHVNAHESGGMVREATGLMPSRHFVLIPGFMGFDRLGDLSYFHGVRDLLGEMGAEDGTDVVVHEVSTIPTAAIQRRAAHVLDALAEVVETTEGPLHLIGHSTGGLDARLAVAPTASLPTKTRQKPIYERVSSLVTIQTPHHGSPLASFFASAMGKPLLRALAGLSIVAVDRGQLPLAVVLKLGQWLSRADDMVGLNETTLDEIYRHLLADWSPERRKVVKEFLEQISTDQALVFQLTPEAVAVLNTCTANPEEVCCGSVVTHAARPALRNLLRLKHDVYAQALHGLYATIWRLVATARTMAAIDDDELLEMLSDCESWDNDGIVPSQSQIWGTLVHEATADHLDTVGHFGGRGSTDWFPSLSGFDDDAFVALWRDVTQFCLESEKQAA